MLLMFSLHVKCGSASRCFKHFSDSTTIGIILGLLSYLVNYIMLIDFVSNMKRLQRSMTVDIISICLHAVFSICVSTQLAQNVVMISLVSLSMHHVGMDGQRVSFTMS